MYVMVGFIGDINNNPQLNCVYQSDDAQNEFLSNPKVQFNLKTNIVQYVLSLQYKYLHE